MLIANQELALLSFITYADNDSPANTESRRPLIAEGIKLGDSVVMVRFSRLENINKKGSVAMMKGSNKNFSILFKTNIIAKIKKSKINLK